MNATRRQFLGGLGMAAGVATLAACGNQQDTSATSTEQTEATGSASFSLALDNAAWSYDADDDVYYQLGISYCETPADESYEQLALIVPAAYFDATDNGDGTYTCTVSASGTAGPYTAATAPIVMPVNTPGYSAQSPMTSYSSQADYTGAGFVYAHAGCRGREQGAPAGVTDLKAAVRFLRAVAADLPGDTERIFTFGMSGGGAQSALMGATGDAPEYEPYLVAIGAADGVSDAVLGSMDWCPITNLDSADAAYEWMMGCTRSDLSEDDQAISDGLAAAFATYVNAAEIRDESGAVLVLKESDEGIWQGGTYYDRVKQAIETSLNDFLSDTEFPYDASSAGGMGGFGGPGGGGGRGAGGPGGGRPDGDFGDFGGPDGPDGNGPGGNFGGPDGNGPDGENGAEGTASFEDMDNIARSSSASALVSLSGTYDTVADYIATLNGTEELGEWVSYDEATNTATITSVAAFARAFKPVSKELGAFDQLDRGQGENTLFGRDGEGAHFDEMLAEVLDDLGSDYAADYAEDFLVTDDEGNTPLQRLAMYSPLYYLLASGAGYGTSNPASHWRIRSGIAQSDTSLTTELNLALALQNDERVADVDFAAVWGMQHVEAERTGSSTENFIAWVNDCLA